MNEHVNRKSRIVGVQKEGLMCSISISILSQQWTVRRSCLSVSWHSCFRSMYRSHCRLRQCLATRSRLQLATLCAHNSHTLPCCVVPSRRFCVTRDRLTQMVAKDDHASLPSRLLHVLLLLLIPSEPNTVQHLPHFKTLLAL